MEHILRYKKFTGIKPLVHELTIPYYKPGKIKIAATLDEIELHYNENVKLYKEKKDKKTEGGFHLTDKVLVLECEY